MSNFINKTFHKHSCIKVRIYFPDRRAKTYWIIPDTSGNVTIKGMSFIIDKERMYLEKGVPTFIFSNHTTEPIDPRNAPANKLHTAETFNVALTSKITREFLQSTQRSLDIPTVLSLITLVGVALIGYIVYTNMGELSAQVQALNDLLNQLTGGVIGGQ